MSESSPSRDLRLPLYVLLGVLAGGTFVAFDMLSEARIGSGTLSGPLAHAHAVVDHVLPVVVGGLLGVGAHYLRLRRRLGRAEEAASRAEALELRLQRVERDQAVWVLAAAMLHELNNPLHAAGLLLDELEASADPDDRTDLIGRARDQVGRALGRLGALRSLGQSGEPDLGEVPLDEIVESLAEDMGTLAARDGLSVRVEARAPVRATADASYVRTIIENLVDNSLHSLREQGSGQVTIRLGVDGGFATVLVSDDGPPLDAAASELVFEPLRTTKQRGLGLGLPIARALARAMSGDLRLDDGDKKTFRLVLPARGSA